MKKADIAAEVYSYLSRAIAHLLIEGHKETGCKNVLIAGGVSSSARFLVRFVLVLPAMAPYSVHYSE